MAYVYSTEPQEFELRFAQIDDLWNIDKIFKSPLKPKTVFARHPDAVEEAILNNRFFILEGPDGEINTMAGVYLEHVQTTQGTSIDKNGRLKHRPLILDIGEVGSIYRPKEFPAGFGLELMYSACEIQTCRRAGPACISTLVTQKTSEDIAGIAALDKLGHGWTPFLPAEGFWGAFKETIGDEKSLEIPLTSFCVEPSLALVQASKSLLGQKASPKFLAIDKNTIRAFDRPTGTPVYIGMGDTRLLQTAKKIVALNEITPLDSMLPEGTPWFAVKEICNNKTKITGPEQMPEGRSHQKRLGNCQGSSSVHQARIS